MVNDTGLTEMEIEYMQRELIKLHKKDSKLEEEIIDLKRRKK
jgi:hypothetical protein